MKKAAGKFTAILTAAAMMLTTGTFPEAGGMFGFLTQEVFAAESFTYLNRTWDKNEKKVIGTNETLSDYELLKDVKTFDSGAVWIGNGKVNDPVWYVVNSDYTINDILVINGAASILICDGATLTVKKGIVVNTGKADGSRNVLNIYGQEKDSGRIIATGRKYCAGIGGAEDRESGIITIYGGTIEATGGEEAAGIGGGDEFSNYTINIYGGKITAKGGRLAAGIGGGDDGEGGNINIYDADITARGGYYGAGIGGGNSGDGGTIRIDYMRGDARGGERAAGIGGGDGGDSGKITINGGEFNAYGTVSKDYEESDDDWYDPDGGAGIGGGDGGKGTDITINGGTVIAEGAMNAAGIGGGDGGKGINITINGGYIKVRGGEGAAGIGGGDNAKAENITITGGSISSSGGYGGAGIGGGKGRDLSYIHISGGTVTAYSSEGAGIGGGYNGDLEKFVMDGGDVRASGAGGSSAVGSGLNSNFSGTIEISGGNLDAKSFLHKEGAPAPIGAGRKGHFKSSGKIIFKGGNVSAHLNAMAKRMPTRMIGSGYCDDKYYDCDGKIELADNMTVVKVNDDWEETIVKKDDRIKAVTDKQDYDLRVRECNHPQGKDVFDETDQLHHRFYCDCCKSDYILRTHNQARSNWEWADDYRSASVTFYCQYCDHDYSFDSSKVTVTSKTTKQATDQSVGEIVYTASVDYEGKTLTDKKTVVIPKTEWTYKSEQLKAVEDMAKSGDSAAASALIAAAKSKITAVNYDSSKSPDDNNAVIDAIVSNLATDLEKQRNIDGFAAYKNIKTETAANMAHSGDCAECVALITAAQAAIGAAGYDETKTPEENNAAIDGIIENLAADLASQRNADDFDKYKNEQKAIADGLLKDGDSEEIKALIEAAKSDIGSLSYDKEKSLDDNKAAVKAIITKLTSDIAAKRTNPRDNPEDVFNSYKEALKKALNEIYTTYDSARIRAVIDGAMPSVEGLTYDSGKTFDENITVINDLITDLDKALDNADFNDKFDAYKSDRKAAADALAKAGDSTEITTLINNAKAAVDVLAYDAEKTLDDNKAAVDAVITKLTSDIDLQRDKDEFAAYKATAKASIDALAKDTDTSGVTKLINNARADVNAYVYDETKSLAFNKNAIDSIVSDVTAKISGQSDADVFETYKTAQKAAADVLAIPNDCEEAKYLIAEAKSAIGALKFLESRTLDENKEAVDEIIDKLKDDLERDRNKDAFDEYKNKQKTAADKLSKSIDSAMVRTLITEAKTAINALENNEDKTLAENKAAVDTIFGKLVSDVEIQRSIDEFNTYRTEQSSAVDALSRSDDSAAAAKLISDAHDAIDALVFDETKTLAENKTEVDTIVSKLISDLTPVRNNDAFEKYKTEQKAIADGFAKEGDPAEKTARIATAKAAIDALTYDTTKSLDANKEAVRAIITGLTNELGKTYGKDVFDSYKEALKKAAQEVYDHPEASDAIKQIITDAMPKIDALTYNTDKTFEENVAVMEALIDEIDASLEAQSSKEDFASYKDAQIKAVKALERDSDGEAARKLINDAKTAISGLTYDETKTLDKNKAAVDAVVEKLRSDLASQRKDDDESNDFNRYKNLKKEAAKTIARDTSDTNVKVMVDEAISEIDKLTYDKTKSIDENKAAVDKIFDKLVNDVEAYQKTLSFTIEFDSYGGSEAAPVTVKYGELLTAPTVTRDGYEFVNWTLDGKPYDFTKPVTKSFKLIAEWAPVKYTVTFYLNGEKYSEAKVEHGKLVEFPDVKVKNGYALYGWMKDPELKNNFSRSTVVTGPLELYAEERKASDVLLNGEKADSLADALIARSGKYSIIGINADQTGLKKMTFAKAADTALIGIEGNGRTLAFEGSANIKPNQTFVLSELTLKAEKGGKAQNVTITSAAGDGGGLLLDEMKIEGKKATVNATKGDLILNDVSSDCQLDVKGSAKTMLGAFGEVKAANVTGFDVVELKGKLTIEKKLAVNRINFYDGAELIIKNGATVSLKKGISGNGTVHLCDGYKSFEIKGTADGSIKITADSKFADKQQIFKSSLMDLDKVFDISDVVPEVKDGSYDYGLYTKSGKVYVRAYKMKLDGARYCEWGDIVKDINKKNVKTAEYTIELLSDLAPGNTFKLPGKGKYAGLTIYGRGHTFKFTASSLGLTGNLKLTDVKFGSTAKKGCIIKLNKFSFDHTDADLVNCREK